MVGSCSAAALPSRPDKGEGGEPVRDEYADASEGEGGGGAKPSRWELESEGRNRLSLLDPSTGVRTDTIAPGMPG